MEEEEEEVVEEEEKMILFRLCGTDVSSDEEVW